MFHLRQPYSIHCLLYIYILFNECIRSESERVQNSTGYTASDYAYSTDANRVKNIVALYETLTNFKDSTYTEKQNVIISLPEAASKLRSLSVGYPLEFRCNKYVKLVSRPNIRTYATINLLMEETRMFNDVDQPDVDIVERLINERSFDALGRIQTLLQSLNSEKTNLKSDYAPEVQKDFFECINYYIYRHQRATFSLIPFVRDAIQSVDGKLVTPTEHEVILREFESSTNTIMELEKKGLDVGQNLRAWLKELDTLHQLVVNNNFEVPKIVRELINDPKRGEVLHRVDKAINRINELWIKCRNHNMSGDTIASSYLQELTELQSLVGEYGSLIDSRIVDFVMDSRRQESNFSRPKPVLGLDNITPSKKVKITKHQPNVRELCDRKHKEMRSARDDLLKNGASKKDIIWFSRLLNRFITECLPNGGHNSRWSNKEIWNGVQTWIKRPLYGVRGMSTAEKNALRNIEKRLLETNL